MRYSILAIFTAFIIILSCNSSKKSRGLMSGDNLPAEEYTINVDRDTVLVTKNGALLKIPKGSLSTDNGNTVKLEIKEAYSLQQMIQAGLVTQSNGEPLSSGGMIYINAAAGQNVTIRQAIKVAIPANYLESGMQLFKGMKDENGNINWKDPKSLPENKQLSSVGLGRTLFQNRCASCHAIGRDMTGPNLAHFMRRFPPSSENEWYYEHGMRLDYECCGGSDVDTSNRYHLDHLLEFGGDNIYKCNLIRRYGSVGPRMFTDTNNNLLDIYRYIQDESERRNLPLPAHAYLKDCADSCREYRNTVDRLNAKQDSMRVARASKIAGNGKMVEKNNTPLPATSVPPIATTGPVNFEERVSPENYDAEYYQFTIETFGWFNIDILLKGMDGVEDSELFVRLIGQYRERVEVFLIIPSRKVYVEGGPAERNEEEFAFYLKNGKIPLPQNEKAYILAVTEREESIAFVLKEFTTGLKQEFEISLSASSKEEFTKQIGQLGLDDLNINVNDSKNASEIRKTDTEIKSIDQELKSAEKLKPKNCNCDCGSRPIADTVKTVGPESADYAPGKQ